MNTARSITKAKLVEIRWDSAGRAETVGEPFSVQFNPATLRVTYSNQVQTNDQANSASTQYVGKGSTKLDIELIFDISMPGAADPEGGAKPDVRWTIQKLAKFMEPKPDTEGGGGGSGGSQQPRYIAPGVRFIWGTFLFDGIVDSMNETLELWSEDGRPLRATVSMSLSQQGIVVGRNPNPDATPAPPTPSGQPGTTPLQAARAGDSIQDMAGRAGKLGDWKGIAEINGIENPRNLAPGTLINLNVKPRISIR